MDIDFFKFAKENFLIFEYNYEQRDEDNIVAMSRFCGDKVYKVKVGEIVKGFIDIIDFYREVENLPVVVTWGDFSYGKFHRCFKSENFVHFDLMEAYMKIHNTSSYLKLSSFMFGDYNNLEKRVLGINRALDKLLKRSNLNQSSNITDYIPAEIIAKAEKYKIEKTIGVCEDEGESKRRRL